MSMDKPITEQEGIMFAANPAWERRNKKKSFGARKVAAPAPTVAPEPRTFAAERDYEEPMALETPVSRPTVATRPVTRETVADEGLVAAPIGRPSASRTTAKRAHKTSVAPAALAAGLVALGAVGAVGWYATRGGDDGIPELSPGQATTSEIAAAPMPPVEAPPAAPVVQPAATPPAPAAEAAPARRVAQAAPRVRPAAAAPSAGDSGMNASTTTTLPDGPQPYTTLNPGAAPPAVTPAPAPVTPPVSEATPAPATEAPAAVPETPPTLPVPPASQAPADTTPPTS